MRREDRAEQSHIVFLLTFTERGEVLQPPANNIRFEVFLNCCQDLNDSQEHKYVCTVRAEGELLSQQVDLCVCVRGKREVRW